MLTLHNAGLVSELLLQKNGSLVSTEKNKTAGGVGSRSYAEVPAAVYIRLRFVLLYFKRISSGPLQRA